MYEYFCKNAAGTIVYCRAQDDDGNGNYEGLTVCEPFTPQCNGNANQLNCGNALPGQTEARFVDASQGSGYSWIDSHGRANCLHKYGLFYEKFVEDTFATHSNAYNADESLYTTMRPCYPDSTISPFRSLYENVVSVLDGDFVEALGIDRAAYDLGFACAKRAS